MQLLFSYGTLQQDSVQLANFGRKLVGYKDSLPLYKIDQLRITDPRVLKESGREFHPILQFTGKPGDEVSGTVFELTESEISAADDYEVDDYQRVKATLKSGRICWVYAAANMSKSKV
ncbi:MAG: Uncharacterised protein [Cellvibrionales bacterium UBA7375]|nr:MAG: Uncharacterised protein [Cellvibrionales bacterium UBA7375]|tara:strand:- start:195 stop:548 length:354 start_codon:yes stop_codon:yes gene_type:complete